MVLDLLQTPSTPAETLFLATMEHGAHVMQQCGLVSHLQSLILVSCRVFFTAAAKRKPQNFKGRVVSVALGLRKHYPVVFWSVFHTPATVQSTLWCSQGYCEVILLLEKALLGNSKSCFQLHC